MDMGKCYTSIPVEIGNITKYENELALELVIQKFKIYNIHLFEPTIFPYPLYITEIVYITMAGKEGFQIVKDGKWQNTNYLIGLKNCIIEHNHHSKEFNNETTSKILLSAMVHSLICDYANENHMIPPNCEYHTDDDSDNFSKFINLVYEYLCN